MSKYLIEIDDLNFTYPNGKEALKNFTYQFKAGTICALVGINGSGKSTLFKSLMGFLKPNSGRISLNGLKLKQALKQNLVSYVPQNEEIDWHFPILVEDFRFQHFGIPDIWVQH